MLEGSHGVTCCMSYPVIRKSHFGKLIHCATSSLEASSPLPLPVSVLLWSPPAEIVTFHHSCVSNVHTRGPPVMYRSPDKIECRPLLKCEQGAGVWGCSVFSEWYGLRELACGCLDFIEGWMSQLGKIICRPPAFVALWRGQCDIIWHIAIVYPVSVLFEEMSGIPILPFWTTFACAVIPAV